MDFTNFKNYLDTLQEKYNVPGFDCVVAKDHQILFRYFAGMSDKENGARMKGDELYLIFSMTKMLTCTAALQLFERGVYTLSDKVSDYLPEFEKMKVSTDELNTANASKITTGATAGEESETTGIKDAENPVTIKHLFTMSAGLDYGLNDEAIKNAIADGKKTTREFVGAMANKVLGFEPGTRFRYSLCHDVLGALVEVWSGESLGEYMEKNIFSPLGMKNTFFGVAKDKERLSKYAALYRHETDEDGNRTLLRLPLTCVFNLSDEYESGGAGLTSCVEDYALFLDAIACGGVGKNGNRILSSATVELMGTNHLNPEQMQDFEKLRMGYGYGLGVRVHTDRAKSGSLSPLGEFGWDGAAGAFSMVDPKSKLSLTYFQHVHKWQLKQLIEMRNALYSCLD